MKISPVLSLLLLVFLSGCGTGEPPGLGFPRGAVAAEAPLSVIPDRDWGWTEQRSLWLFRGSARLLFLVGDEAPAEAALTVFLHATEETIGYRFRAEWDGVRLGEAPPAPSATGKLLLPLPAGSLTPGRHELKLTRLFQRGDAGLDNTFTALGYEIGGEGGDGPGEPQRRELDLARLPLFRQVADFVDLGLAGEGNQKRGGLLFLGSGIREWPLSLADSGYLELSTDNFAAEAATFTVGLGSERHSLEVLPGAGRPLRIPLEAGKYRLSLQVEGMEEGAYLWGAPHFEPTERPPEAAGTPVILVTLDTTRRDALSPYNPALRELGDGGGLTPHLEEFVRHATVYEQAYSTGPWTLTTHGSLMTGLYPSRHTAGVTASFLPGHLPTLAKILGREGYRTAGFIGGKLASHTFGVGQGFDLYRNPDSFETVGDRLTNYLVGFLDQYHRQDLFLFANYFDPHALYQAPEPFQRRAGVEAHRTALTGKPFWEAFDRGNTGAWRQIIDGNAAPVDEGIAAYLKAVYHAEVAFLDHQLGRLFRELQRHGLYDRALIILVADHGELLGEYGGLVSHAGRLDPELVEIPLLVKWPHQKDGERVPSVVSQVDVLPTVLQSLGLPFPEGLDGRPLPRPGEPGAEPEGRRALLMEEHESRVHPLPPRLRLATHVYGVQRLLERQVVWKGSGECSARDAVDSAWTPTLCERPEALLARLEQDLGSKAKVEGAGVLSKEQEEGLKALGYL